MRKLPTVGGGSGPRFVREVGVVAPMLRSDSGDGVVPAAIVDQRHAGAAFLVAGSDIDVGDVPENAVARLITLGIRAVLAPGFERAFHSKCLTHAVLPVILDEAVAGELVARCESEPSVEITVDLEQQAIDWPGMQRIAFELDVRVRNKLLLGLTDLEETLRYVGDITAMRAADRSRRPWLYEPPGGGDPSGDAPGPSRPGGQRPRTDGEAPEPNR